MFKKMSLVYHRSIILFILLLLFCFYFFMYQYSFFLKKTHENTNQYKEYCKLLDTINSTHIPMTFNIKFSLHLADIFYHFINYFNNDHFSNPIKVTGQPLLKHTTFVYSLFGTNAAGVSIIKKDFLQNDTFAYLNSKEYKENSFEDNIFSNLKNMILFLRYWTHAPRIGVFGDKQFVQLAEKSNLISRIFGFSFAKSKKILLLDSSNKNDNFNNLSALFITSPRFLSVKNIFAIDQYLLRGGFVFIFAPENASLFFSNLSENTQILLVSLFKQWGFKQKDWESSYNKLFTPIVLGGQHESIFVDKINKNIINNAINKNNKIKNTIFSMRKLYILNVTKNDKNTNGRIIIFFNIDAKSVLYHSPKFFTKLISSYFLMYKHLKPTSSASSAPSASSASCF